LELSKLVGIVADGMPSITGFKNDKMSPPYKHMHELGFHNELIQYPLAKPNWHSSRI